MDTVRLTPNLQTHGSQHPKGLLHPVEEYHQTRRRLFQDKERIEACYQKHQQTCPGTLRNSIITETQTGHPVCMLFEDNLEISYLYNVFVLQSLRLVC